MIRKDNRKCSFYSLQMTNTFLLYIVFKLITSWLVLILQVHENCTFPFAFQIGSINGGGRMLQAVQRRSFAFQEVIFNHQEVDAGSRRCRHQFVVRPMIFLE